MFSQRQSYAQTNLDSLWQVWNDPNQPDTNRCKAIDDIVWGYMFIQPDSAFYYAQQLNDFAHSKNLKKYEASALNMQGVSFYVRSDYPKAIDYYNISLKIFEEIGYKKGIASSNNNIGSVYFDQGNYPNAIIFYAKSLKTYESLGFKQGIASSYNNIGLIYSDQGDYPKAIDYFTKSLKIREEIGDNKGISTSYNNIGNIYYYHGDYPKAIDHYTKSLKIDEEIGDKQGIANSYYNIGNIYKEQGDYSKAIDYYIKSLKITEEIGDKQGIANSYNGLADAYLQNGEIKKAHSQATKALQIAKEIGSIIPIKDAAENLWEINKKLGKYHKALEMHELYIEMRDSIESEESQRAVIQQQYRYAYEKQAATDSVSHAKTTEIKNIEIAKQRAEIKAKKNQQYLLYGGVSVLLLFLGFVFNRLQVTRKQKTLIEEKNEEIERAHEELAEHHKEITDSINYAKRIQDAMLASEEHESPHLPEHFILFKPKDVVSGDFYWALEKQGYLYLTAADCTGHGVPGAFMSMLGMSFLNEINSHEKLLTPAEILDELRRRIIKELGQTGAEGENKDGMDISLVRINLNNPTQLMWAGANNPLYHVKKLDGKQTPKDVQTETHFLQTIAPDKQAIGYGFDMKPFTNHEITLQKGDTIVLFTDGFADQFGGEKGKKFKYKSFKQLLLQLKDQPLSEQKAIINTTFENWKGSFEQVDDVCVIGVRL